MALLIQRAWRSYKWRMSREHIIDSLCCSVCQDIRSDILVCCNAHPLCEKCYSSTNDFSLREMTCPTCSDVKGFFPSPTLYLADALKLRSKCGWCNESILIRKKNEHEHYCHYALYECPLDSQCQTMPMNDLFGHIRLHNKSLVFDTTEKDPLIVVVIRKMDFFICFKETVVRISVDRDFRNTNGTLSRALNCFIVSSGVYGSKEIIISIKNYLVDGRECKVHETLCMRVPQLKASEGVPFKTAIFIARTSVAINDTFKEGIMLRGNFEDEIKRKLSSFQFRSQNEKTLERQSAIALQISLSCREE